MNKRVLLFTLLGFNLGLSAQTEHISGQTKLINPTGRTLMIERDDEDSWLTFHDPDEYWYSLGVDRSNSGAFSINYGGYLTSSQFVMNKNGNIGIGATNPYEKLHINGRLYMNAGEGFKLFGDANYFGQYQDGIVFQMHDGNSTNGRTDGGFVFRGFTPVDENHEDWMVIKSGGKVGIGTTTPDSKLAVNGKIHAQEVKVDLTGWSDFVFKDSYKLPTLEEVEHHIQQKGHLKDIPSELEVLEKGIELGVLNTKLLQKIEELTLYTIEQEKALEEQGQKNKELELRLSRIETLLTKESSQNK